MRRARYQFGSVERKKRANGPDVWAYRYRENGVQRSRILGTIVEFPKRAQAIRAAEVFRLDANPDNPASRGVTFGALLDRYINEGMSQRYSTSNSDKSWIRAYIRPKWEGYSIPEVQSGNVQAWLDGLKLEPKSKANILSVMRRAIKCAMRWNLIPLGVNPMSLVEIPRRTKRSSKSSVLSAEEVRRFIGHIEGEPFKTMAWLAVGMGLERSTVVGLRWRDVDFKGGTVFVRTGMVHNHEGPTKNEYREAPLPMAREIAALLQSWKSKTIYVGADDWVFASPFFDGKTPYTPHKINGWYFARAAKSAEIGRKVGWQSLRRTYASLLAKYESRQRVVQSLMRHNDPKTTQNLYQDAYSEDMRQAHSTVVGVLIQ